MSCPSWRRPTRRRPSITTLRQCRVDEAHAVVATDRKKVWPEDGILLSESLYIGPICGRRMQDRIESSRDRAKHGITHSSEILVIGQIAGPDQADAGLVEAALNELPCENSRLSVGRHEYEQRIGTEVPCAV